MSGRKNTLTPIYIITNGDMSGNITSNSTNVQFLDDVSVQIVITGSPTGEFFWDVSLDNTNFVSIPMTPSASISAGSPNDIGIDYERTAFVYVRIRYVFGSGSGTCNAKLSARMQ